jgi:hypothetical protein
MVAPAPGTIPMIVPITELRKKGIAIPQASLMEGILVFMEPTVSTGTVVNPSPRRVRTSPTP